MKKLKYFLIAFSFLVLFIPKAEARIILPALPSGFNEEWPYIITSDGSSMSLTYCKNPNGQIRLRDRYSSNASYTGVQIGECYNSNGGGIGYAYRRDIYNISLTKEQINNYDFEINGNWGNEVNGSWYGTNMIIDPTTRKIITWKEYLEDPKYNVAVISGNTNIYNYNPNTEVLLTPEDYAYGNPEPTYEMEKEILDNGNVKLNFTFNNYDQEAKYGFTISNEVSGEEYGITNPFSSIFPNIIPFQETYSIEIPYDTLIYITLAKYNQIENSNLYTREEIYKNIIDVNNIVFNNEQEPYFSIISQTKNNIKGKFYNAKNNYSCYYKDSNDTIINVVSCNNEEVNHNFSFNGYIEFWIENQNDQKIYSRKINIIGQNNEYPYIVYNVEKQDFYSKIIWNIENEDYDINMTYRYSLDNGNTFTNWELTNDIKNINVFENTTIIIEIANRQQNIVYDSKAINVINSIEEITTFNNTTNNFINKFKNLFNINGEILNNINNYWGIMKISKIYLLIFIPFITSIICGIIYMIRRK